MKYAYVQYSCIYNIQMVSTIGQFATEKQLLLLPMVELWRGYTPTSLNFTY